MKVLLYIGLFVFFVTVAYILSQPATSCYAPPRTADTVLPYDVSPTTFTSDSNTFPIQSDVFEDASGWLNMREHPLSDNFQSNAFAGSDMGDFMGMDSGSGTAVMTVIPANEQYEYNPTASTGSYLPGVTSSAIPFIGCSRSKVIIKDTGIVLLPGTHTINRSMYTMDVYAPLNVVATGPNGERQNMFFNTREQCPVAQRLVLDQDKNYTTLILTLEAQLESLTSPA
jgi:hypothetical protein